MHHIRIREAKTLTSISVPLQATGTQRFDVIKQLGCSLLTRELQNAIKSGSYRLCQNHKAKQHVNYCQIIVPSRKKYCQIIPLFH